MKLTLNSDTVLRAPGGWEDLYLWAECVRGARAEAFGGLWRSVRATVPRVLKGLPSGGLDSPAVPHQARRDCSVGLSWSAGHQTTRRPTPPMGRPYPADHLTMYASSCVHHGHPYSARARSQAARYL